MNFRILTSGVSVLCLSTWCLNKNQSVEFLQSLNRNASLEADAAFHNPAGLAFLKANGLYLGGGSQIILEDRTIQESTDLLNAYGPSQYEGAIHSWVFPTIQAVYHKDDLSLFLHGGPLGGGGVGEFDQGLPKFDNMILGYATQIGSTVKAMVDTSYQRQLALGGLPGMHVTTGTVQSLQYHRDMSFTGDEMTLGGTMGACYRIVPTVSLSAAYRFSYARNAYQGSAKVSVLKVAYQGSQGLPLANVSGASVDSTLNAQARHVMDSLWRNVDVDVVSTGVAHGVVLGADFKPNEIWNIGVRFEWNSELELTNETSTLVAPDGLVPYLASFADGAKTNLTEPMVLAAGVSWKGVRDLTLESSWTYAFYENVDRGGLEALYHNSLFAGLGARYQVIPNLETSVGYAYDWAFKDNAAREETDFDLPTHYFSTGLGFQATPRLKLNAGAMYGLALDRHGISIASGAEQKMTSNTIDLGIGVEWSPGI